MLPVEYVFVAACAEPPTTATSSAAVTARRLIAGSGVPEQLVRVRHRLDRELRGLERRLGDQHLLRCVLGRPWVVLDRGLELRLDSCCLEDRLDLLGLGDVLGERDLHESGHRAVSSCMAVLFSPGASSPRLWSAPPLIRCGPPRSWNRTSMISKSFGTTVSGKTARASPPPSRPKYSVDRCVRASI